MRRWNGKAIVDEMGERLWDTSTAYQDKIIRWANEIQDDIVSELPLDFFKHRLKKLLPVDKEIVSLRLPKPAIGAVLEDLDNAILYNAANDAEFSYDAAALETTATAAQLKDRGGTELFYAPYTTDTSASSAAGTPTITEVGTPSIVSGTLDLTGGNDGVKYSGLTDLLNGNTGTILIKYKPNYTGSPAANSYLVSVKNIAVANSNLIEIYHKSDGNIILNMRDSAGVAQVSNKNFGGWSPVAGTFYDIELSFDTTAGAIKTFINQSQFGTTDTSTFTRTGSTDINVGLNAAGAASSSPDAFIDHVQVTNTPLDGTNTTGSIYDASTYQRTDEKITTLTALNLDVFASFAAVSTETGNDLLKYIIKVDSQDKYWDGAAWANSDGTYAQSSTEAQINTNALSLGVTASQEVLIVVFFHSGSGYTTPTLTSLTVSEAGSLTVGSTYKVYTTFMVYDGDLESYMESLPSEASAQVSPTSTARQITVTLDLFDGDTAAEPTAIYRRVYLSEKTAGSTEFGEPFFCSAVEDNTTLTYSIVNDAVTTVTPPSDSELDQITSDHPFFISSNKYLTKIDQNQIRRFDPNSSNSTTPDAYDYVGTEKILIYPKLSATATDAQRTLVYHVYRRPKELFYDIDRAIDLPIAFKKVLMEGILWKGYDHRDRSGKESVLANYEEFKKQALKKLKRQKGKPTVVRDVDGDTWGYEV